MCRSLPSSQQHREDLHQVLKGLISSKKRISHLIMITTVTLSAGLYRTGFASLFPFLQAEFEVSRAVIGMYTSLLYLVSACLSVFTGWIADRIGAKKGMLIGIGSIGVLLAVHALAPSFALVLALAAVCGVGFSIVSPAAAKGVARWFSPSERGTPMGIMSTGWALGGVIGAGSLPVLAGLFGWRTAAVAAGALILTAAGIIHHFYHRPSDSDEESAPADGQHSSLPALDSLREDFLRLVADRRMLLLCFLGLIFGGIGGSVASHFTLFLHLDHGFTEEFAGLSFALLQVGSVLGRPGWGLVSEKLLAGSRRKGFLLLSTGIALVAMSFGLSFRLFPQASTLLLVMMGFLAGATARGYPGILYAAVSEQAGKERSGISMGFCLIFVRLGITLAPPAFGYLADVTGTYELSWLVAGLLVLAGGFIAYRNGRPEPPAKA